MECYFLLIFCSFVNHHLFYLVEAERYKVLQLIAGIVGTVVTIISIIVTVISIRQNKKILRHQKKPMIGSGRNRNLVEI